MNQRLKEDSILKKLVNKYRLKTKNYKYPLLDDAFSSDDLLKGIKVILSGQLTMSKITREFEKKFARFVKSRYAVMVNSGSSANLLSVFASCNPTRKNRFKKGDEAIIPALCWPTSLWPLVQSGLKPVFVDTEIKSLNVNSDEVIKKINKKTKVIMLVHVLGNSTNVEKIRKVAKQKKIILIEDTCESLGTTFKNKYLGTFGDFGTYSFYYSHQISSGEGGMITCNSFSDYQLLLSMRSHGWSRNLQIHKNIENKYPKLDKQFIFINSGFNLRPTDIVAAIGLNQFKRLKQFKKIRYQNRSKIIKSLISSKKWKKQFSFLEISKYVNPSLFGFPIFLNENNKENKKNILDYLKKKKIETRPIISGNFLNQPAIKLYKIKDNPNKFCNAQQVENRGFFIGLHSKPISEPNLKYLVDSLLSANEI